MPPGGLWVIPPYQAMWVPRRPRAPRVEMGGRVSMRTLYFHTSLCSGLPAATCRVVRVSPLLRELLLQAVRLRTLDTRERSERHLIDVLLDQLAVLPVAPLALPMPRDPSVRHGRQSCERARRRMHDSALEELAKEAGASPRTLERLFRAETGLAVGAWHQRARMRCARSSSWPRASKSRGPRSASATKARARSSRPSADRSARLPVATSAHIVQDAFARPQ